MNPLAGVLSEAWGMYKAYAKHLLTIAFVIYVAAAIIAAILSLAGTIGALLGSLVSIVAAFLLQATLVKAVQDVRDGRVDMSIGETVSAVVPYLGAVIVASLLAGIAIVIGLALIIAPGLYLITIWAVIVPVIVIEGVGALASFGRSRALVRGHGWHVFGTLVMVYVILLVVDLILAHGGAGVVARVEEHGEHVGATSSPFCTTSANLRAKNRAGLRAVPQEASPWTERAQVAPHERQEQHGPGRRIDGSRKNVGELGEASSGFQPEDRAYDDLERDGLHRSDDGERFADRQAIDRGVSELGHRPSVGREPVAMKGRQHHPALPPVLGTVEQNDGMLAEQRL